MMPSNASHADLHAEIADLRFRLEEAEETLRAIGAGEIDALVVSGTDGDQVFTLKGAEQPYRVLVESMSEGAATLLADSTIFYGNSRLADMLQTPLERLIGTRLNSYMVPADQAFFTDLLETCGAERMTLETVFLSASGNTVPVHISCCSTDFSASREVYVVVTDLSESKKAESMQREREQFIRATLDGLSAKVCVIDALGKIVITNRAWNSVYEDENLTREKCGEGANYLDACRSDTRGKDPEVEIIAAGIRAVMRGDVPNYIIEYDCHSQEIERWYICRVNPFHVSGATFAVISHEDITSRRLAETALQRLTDEQSVILENAGVGIAFVQNRRIKWANVAFGVIFGYSSAEMADVSTSLFYPSAEIFEEFGKEAYPVLATGGTFAKELQMCRRDGTQIFARFTGKAINPASPAAGSIWILSDETNSNILKNELYAARDAAESANSAKSEFLSNMSHEIRTPMNGVIGMAQLLEFTELDKEQREYVNALKLSGKNLLSLINDILDLSKIEAGKIKIQPEEFSLKHCINDMILTQKSAIFQKGLNLNVVVADDIPHVLVGDQLRVKQILLNLLGNAVKFTAQGSITIAAKLLERQGSFARVQLTVSDSGIGIAATALETIFKPFTQEDGSTTRTFGGTGLGLTISRRLAELMGGSIAVSSIPAVGSCFSVVLPFTVVTSAETTGEVHHEVIDFRNGPALRVLLVEDNPVNTQYGTALLGKLGHEVVAVGNGRECLAALAQSSFDLVLMDIQMPVMNGEETLKEIRRNDQKNGTHLPVIALTAYALRGEKERFREEGFDGYVSKPIVVEELIKEMKQVMVKGEG
jgi:signal transduction histidine kinase/ActR/RegA family two-component response regulator